MKTGVGAKQTILRFSVALVAVISLMTATFLPAAETYAVVDANGGGGGGGNGYTDMTLEERAQSYALYYGVVKCLTGETKISNDDVINNDIDGAGNSYLRSYYIDASDGKSQCQKAFSQGVSLWGYGDLGAALLAWGYTAPTGSSNNWTAPKPGETTAKALRDRIYSGDQPILKAPEAYVYWVKSLGAACQLSNPNEYATATTAEKAAVDRTGQTDYVKVQEVKPDRTGTVEMIYTIGSDSHVNSYVMPVNSPLYEPTGYSCQQMADLVTKAAPGYITYAKVNGVDKTPPTSAGGGVNSAGGSGEKTCKIDGVGWIVCPVMIFIAKINDKAFGFIANNFLEVKTTSLTDTSSPLYKAWSAFRNIANIAFVVVFLIIIYSQLTGVGITNYGLKRMIPKLIIAAVLVNTSYYICLIAVDLSNLLGYGIKSLFDTVGGSVPNLNGKNGTWETAISGILVGGFGTLAIGMAISGPVLMASLLAVVLTLFILLARQALIILLIVVAPLALVAYMLPNTEQLFKKWQKAFATVLLVFPIVGLLFGASTLASNIIKSAKQPDETTSLILALGILAIPLFALPSLLKGSLSAAGAIGAKLQGLADSSSGRIGKQVKDTSRLGAYQNARARNAQIKRAQITGGIYTGKNPLAKASSKFSGVLNASKITGSAGTRVAQQAAQLSKKLEVENIEAATAQIDQANISGADLRRVSQGQKAGGLDGGDASMRAAAAVEMAARGDYGGLADAWDSVRNANGEAQRIFAGALSRSRDKPAYIGAGAIQQMREGTAQSHDNVAVQGVNAGAYSPEKLASASRQELDYVGRLIDHGETDGRGNGVNIAVLQGAAATATSNPEINKAIAKNRDKIEAFSAGTYHQLDVDSDGQYSSAHRNGD